MTTTVDILYFYYQLYNPWYNQLTKIKYAFNLETLIGLYFSNNTNFQTPIRIRQTHSQNKMGGGGVVKEDDCVNP